MTPSSKERREVAERLRKCGDELSMLGADCETGFHVIDKVIGCREEDSWERFLGLLAGLIDPTCQMKSMSKSRYSVCCRCGAFVRKDAVTNCTETIPVRFCPNCGARVVDDA